MQAAPFVYDDGEPTVQPSELEEPTPGDGEAVVDVAACALNHSDLWTLEAGAFDAPYVAGADFAGTVASAPADAPVSAGDRVVHCPNRTCGTCRRCREGPETLCASYAIAYGGFAERTAAPVDRLVPLPDGVSFRDAAALPIAYMTALHMLRRAEVREGDTVFVPGATGGVGVAAVQLAAGRGARVVGSTGASAKADRLRELGAEVVIEDDVDALREAVADLGADAAINHLGGPFTAVGLAALGRGGRMALCGRTAGAESTVDVSDLFWQHKRVIGSSMGTQADLERLVRLVEDGTLEPVVDAEFPLAETPAAFEAMRGRELFGKALVRTAA